MLETIGSRWSGPKWRLWSFVGGILSVGLVIAIAFLISIVSGERLIPLVLLLLVAVILITSVFGSGIIDSLSSQMNRGGLARETTDDVDRALGDGRGAEPDLNSDEQDDRRTIRSGLFIIGPIAAFVYFMTIV